MEHIHDGCRGRCRRPDRPAVRRGLDSDRSHREVSGASKPRGADACAVRHRAVVTILLSIPDQSDRLLGIELIALALIAGASQRILDRRARRDLRPRDDGAHALALVLDAVAPNAVTAILILVAGGLLAFNVHAGLDLLVLPVLVALGGGVTSAWLLLTKIPEEPR
jgi:hypothetical protein